jgi:hypothetical protein
MVVLLQQPQAQEATMSRSSIGGMDAARPRARGRQVVLYRHALVRLLSTLLQPLATGVGWSPATLALAAILMSLDAAPTLAQRFESALGTLDAALPRRRRTGRTYQGFVKALSRWSGAIFLVLEPSLRRACQRTAGRAWRLGGADGLVPIGVDGSKINAPRTIANEALGFAGKDKCGPQIMTLLLVHLGSMIPWAWKTAGVCTSERTLLRGVLHLLPDRTLLVADAGFTGFELLSDLRRRGVHFLVRVGSGTRLLAQLGSYRREGKHTVYLWPDRHRAQPPLTLRLVRVGGVYLITDLTDPRRLSKRAAGELYRRRWGLEVAFRSLKQTLEHRAVRSGTARHALTELNWALLGLQVLTLLGAAALRAAGQEPRRLSLAGALRAVRAATRHAGGARRLRERLRRATLDPYRRQASKRSYRWPRQKTPPRLGPPTIAVATRPQTQAAARLQSHTALCSSRRCVPLHGTNDALRCCVVLRTRGPRHQCFRWRNPPTAMPKMCAAKCRVIRTLGRGFLMAPPPGLPSVREDRGVGPPGATGMSLRSSRRRPVLRRVLRASKQHRPRPVGRNEPHHENAPNPDQENCSRPSAPGPT